MSQAKYSKIKGLEARLVAVQILTRVIDDHRNLDALCDSEHGLSRFLALPANDRGLARAIAITALRQRGAIETVLNNLLKRPPPKRARFLIHTLHAAAAQILFLDLPDSAVVNLAVTAIGNDERTSRFKAMANAVLRRMAREKSELVEKVFKNPQPFPKWFERKLRSDFGKVKTAQISEMVSREPFVDITVKSNPEGWAEKLGGLVLSEHSVRLLTREHITTLQGYEEGHWWVQDIAASIPARLLNNTKSAQVLDLCAAPGGKTAQLLHAGHEVTALDISRPRLKRLGQNLERLQLHAKLVEADILEWSPTELFDAVLLDAPCSSTGTIRRHPDVMWSKSEQDIKDLANLQFSLVEKACEFVKPGGVFIFSNCSIFKEEGEALLVRILNKLDCLELNHISPEEFSQMPEIINGQGAIRTLPFHGPQTIFEQGGMDGFFACRFVKR